MDLIKITIIILILYVTTLLFVNILNPQSTKHPLKQKTISELEHLEFWGVPLESDEQYQ